MLLKTLERLMQEKGINASQLSKGSGVPYSTIRNFWDRGYDNIGISTLKKISAYFGVTLDYLVFGEDTVKKDVFIPSEEEKGLIMKYRGLTDEGKDYARQTLDLAVKGYSKKEGDELEKVKEA